MDLRSLRIGTVALVLLAAGCKEEESPQEKCEALYDLVCDRIGECTSGQSSSTFHSTCIDALEMTASCSRAVDVSDSYDDCIDELDSNECNALFPINPVTNTRSTALPSTCRGSIKIQ